MDEYVHWLAFLRYREKVAERKRAQDEAARRQKPSYRGCDRWPQEPRSHGLFVRVGADVSEAVAGLTLVGRKVTSLGGHVATGGWDANHGGRSAYRWVDVAHPQDRQVTAETAASLSRK
jgi:hypothetical protein